MYAVFSYRAQQPDELEFDVNDKLIILRKGDEAEREWWWAKNEANREGYVPRNLLGVSVFIQLFELCSRSVKDPITIISNDPLCVVVHGAITGRHNAWHNLVPMNDLSEWKIYDRH